MRVACPSCGKRLRVKAALKGKRLKCPGCSNLITVPVEEQPVSPNPHAQGPGLPHRPVPAPVDEQPENHNPPPQPAGVPWALVGAAVAALAAVALLAFLWLGGKSEARGLRD